MNAEIISKLKILGFNDKLILNKPQNLDAFDGIIFDTSVSKPKYDIVFAFIFALDEFSEIVKMAIEKDLINANGYLYFAYPKKGNKQYKEYIGRDDFFTSVHMDKDGFVNGSKLKFNKMVAFNDTFTCIGLKHEKKTKPKTQPSQCIADYIDRIPELQQYFSENKEVTEMFDKLTPGYRRDWARYVYGVKNEETKAKRLAEMEDILKKGYKSIDLYRQNKK